jgi:hypothetical protein
MKKASILFLLVALAISSDAFAWRIIRISKRHHTSGDYRSVGENHNEINGIGLEIHQLSCRGNGAVVCGWEYPPKLTGYDNAVIEIDEFQRLVDDLYLNCESRNYGLIWLGDKMCYRYSFKEVIEDGEVYYDLELAEVER